MNTHAPFRRDVPVGAAGARPKPDLPWERAGWASGACGWVLPPHTYAVALSTRRGEGLGKGREHEGPLQRARRVGVGSGWWRQPGEAGGDHPRGVRSANSREMGAAALPRNLGPRSPPAVRETRTLKCASSRTERDGRVPPARTVVRDADGHKRADGRKPLPRAPRLALPCPRGSLSLQLRVGTAPGGPRPVTSEQSGAALLLTLSFHLLSLSSHWRRSLPRVTVCNTAA